MKASEIVKKAVFLADLENSDFISAEENLFLLNDAYKFVYSKLEEFADGYFVAEFSPEFEASDFSDARKCAELPEDFYKLFFVGNAQGEAMPRTPRNSTSDGYFIANNRLYIKGEWGDEIVVRYMPKPIEIEGYGESEGAEDTDLDYPSNVFFTLMAYQLAESYNTKRMVQNEQLKSKYAEVYDQFVQDLSRDQNQVARIGNFYARRRF